MGIKYLNFEELICAPANSAIAQSGVRFALRISLPGITRALYKPAMIILILKHVNCVDSYLYSQCY